MFPGSKPNELLLLVRQASLDLTPNWIILELVIDAEKVDPSERISVRPVFLLRSELHPSWIRLSADKTWLLLERSRSSQLQLMEVDFKAEDYKDAIGWENEKFEHSIGPVGVFFRDTQGDMLSFVGNDG